MSGLSEVPGRDSSIERTIKAMQAAETEEVQELRAEQESSATSFKESLQEIVNPFAKDISKREKAIRAQGSRVQKALKAGATERALLPIERIKEAAERFQKRNQELQASSLAVLRERIPEGATTEEILRIVNEFYPDAMLADAALEFLQETTEGELAKNVSQAKDLLNTEKGREIAAGNNIANVVRQGAEKGLGAPGTLRDMYRDITGNPRDSATLFDELSQKYPFRELQKVISFLLHSLGADLKSGGPSIARGMLHRLMTETRSLQAILGVYKFFRSRIPLIDKMLAKEGLKRPSQFTFETLAKQFMALISDRYPTSAKVLQGTVRLGIEKWIQAKIIALSQYRDAIRQVAAGQIYRSPQQRDDLYLAILEALEELEDELEDLLDMLGEEGEEEEGEGKQEKEEDQEKEKQE